jgi:Leucine-rich repeat (LRR) protein
MSYFVSLNKLNTLHLQHNKLQVINGNLFAAMRKLSELRLKDNEGQTLDSLSFRNAQDKKPLGI